MFLYFEFYFVFCVFAAALVALTYKVAFAVLSIRVCTSLEVNSQTAALLFPPMAFLSGRTGVKSLPCRGPDRRGDCRGERDRVDVDAHHHHGQRGGERSLRGNSLRRRSPRATDLPFNLRAGERFCDLGMLLTCMSLCRVGCLGGVSSLQGCLRLLTR